MTTNTYNAGPFLKLPLAYFFGFGSLITLLLLSSGPTYAEWIWIDNGKPGMTIYVNPDTIDRKGDRVKMWELFDFETAQKMASEPHLSFKMQHEYDCTQDRNRMVAATFFSRNMGRGTVVYSDSTKGKWESVTPGSLNHDLWEFACSKKQLQAQFYPVEGKAG